MKVAVVVFPGSNCDRDMFHVLTDVFNLNAQYFWHQDKLPKNIDAVILPKKLAESGTPILGVCNGFQILVESGLLPGVLLKNTSLNFMCKWENLIVNNNKTVFTNKLKLGQKIPIPIANGEGRYFADKKLLSELKNNNQIVFSYEDIVNGSTEQIAGICNKEGNVVGMMPHPERATEKIINPTDHKPSSLIFESMINTLGGKN